MQYLLNISLKIKTQYAICFNIKKHHWGIQKSEFKTQHSYMILMSFKSPFLSTIKKKKFANISNKSKNTKDLKLYNPSISYNRYVTLTNSIKAAIHLSITGLVIFEPHNIPSMKKNNEGKKSLLLIEGWHETNFLKQPNYHFPNVVKIKFSKNIYISNVSANIFPCQKQPVTTVIYCISFSSKVLKLNWLILILLTDIFQPSKNVLILKTIQRKLLSIYPEH